MRHAILAVLCWSVLASPVRTIDGDTFSADARIWPGLTARESVRVLGVNSPELHGATAVQGAAARDFTQAWLTGDVTLTVCKRDSFGRALATVRRASDNADLGADLLAAGLAVPFTP